MGYVLDWIRSFLTDRTEQVAYEDRLSVSHPVQFGVPQGSVLGPLLNILYTAELDYVVGRLNLHLHQYADDSQVYVSTSVDDCLAAVDQFTACLSDTLPGCAPPDFG
jgi:hypothetical protein